MNLHAPAAPGHGHSRDHFEALYAESEDPWRLRASWYEQRKRAVLLASLPAFRYHHAYEPACGAGELTRSLARRCQSVLASDGVPRAVALAHERLAGLAHVQVVQAWVPEEWPNERFDLVVLSEFLYFLAPHDLGRLIEKARAAIGSAGTLVACHWRARIEGCAYTGDAVHQQLHAQLGLPRVARYLDADFCLDVWQDAAPSPVQREARR